MKIVPSEFSNSAWNCFIFAKEIAYKNYQQNVDSDNLLFALIKGDNITKNICLFIHITRFWEPNCENFNCYYSLVTLITLIYRSVTWHNF